MGMPSELVENYVSSHMGVVMKSVEGVVGTLLESDDFVSIGLEGVTDFEATPEDRTIIKLDLIWLNGNNITMPLNVFAAVWMLTTLSRLVTVVPCDAQRAAPLHALENRSGGLLDYTQSEELVPGGKEPEV